MHILRKTGAGVELEGVIIALLLAVPLCRAQTQLIAPSDASHLTPEQMRELLRVICPSHVQNYGCEVCPNGSSFHNERWDLAAVYFGHFLSPDSEDALLSGTGCEPHVNGFGGSFLLTHSGGGWRVVNYAPARIANDCQKVKGTDGRDLLICGSSDQHFGIRDQFLYLLDPRVSNLEGRGLDIFLDVADSLRSCESMIQDGRRVVESGNIDRVTFAQIPGVSGLRITVEADLGEAVISGSSLEACNLHLKPGDEWLRPTIRTMRERFVFSFDGKSVTPNPGNPPMEGATAIPPQTQAVLPKTFEAPDGSFSITVPASFRILTGSKLKEAKQLSYIPVCKESDLACFVYPPDAYKGTNFGAASVEVSNINKPDEASCMAAPKPGGEDQFFPPKYMPVRGIGGSRWIHGVFTGAAAGHIDMQDIYRTWREGKCWEIKTNLTETDVEAHPQFTPQDEERVKRQLDAVLREFRFRK